MTRTEFEQKSFEEVMEQLNEERDEITDLDMLKEFAVKAINEGNYFLAIHVLKALQDGNDEDWWNYDYSMGTLDTPTPITEKEDVEHLIED